MARTACRRKSSTAARGTEKQLIRGGRWGKGLRQTRWNSRCQSGGEVVLLGGERVGGWGAKDSLQRRVLKKRAGQQLSLEERIMCDRAWKSRRQTCAFSLCARRAKPDCCRARKSAFQSAWTKGSWRKTGREWSQGAEIKGNGAQLGEAAGEGSNDYVLPVRGGTGACGDGAGQLGDGRPGSAFNLVSLFRHVTASSTRTISWLLEFWTIQPRTFSFFAFTLIRLWRGTRSGISQHDGRASCRRATQHDRAVRFADGAHPSPPIPPLFWPALKCVASRLLKRGEPSASLRPTMRSCE